MKKSSVVLSAALALVMALSVGCTSLGSGSKDSGKAPAKAPATTTDKKAEIVLKLGYGQPTSNPRHITAEKFAKYVNEQTNGKVKIELYPSEMLGSDKQMTEAAVMGTQDMVITAQGVLSTYEPKLNAIGLPFLFSSPDKVGKVLDGPVGQELAKDLPNKGLRLLAYWENGLRHITNNKRPVEKPEDLKGLKIRTPEDKMTLSIFKALGASPAPLAFPELYLALSQNVFDGQENPITNIESSKFYEVQKYLSITNHKYESVPLIISEASWKKMPADVQKVLQEGAVKFAAEHRKLVNDSEAQLLKGLETKGMKISRPDIKAFQDATKSVYTEWESTLGKDLINRIVEAAK